MGFIECFKGRKKGPGIPKVCKWDPMCTYRFGARAQGVPRGSMLGHSVYLKVQGLRILYGIDVLAP